MKEPEYNNLPFFYRKIDRIWKSPEEATPKVLIYVLVKQGIPCNFICTGVKHTKKVFTESLGFSLIPDITADGIFFNFRKKP